jgi:hypothetical protein
MFLLGRGKAVGAAHRDPMKRLFQSGDRVEQCADEQPLMGLLMGLHAARERLT